MISVADFLMKVLGTIGELCTLTVLENKTFEYDLREVEQSLWKYHQKIARSRLFYNDINNHGLIMYTKGAREQSYSNVLLSSTVSIHNSPIVPNTFIRKSATEIILVGHL